MFLRSQQDTSILERALRIAFCGEEKSSIRFILTKNIGTNVRKDYVSGHFSCSAIIGISGNKGTNASEPNEVSLSEITRF
jgi:hypothetical protein